jgi:hypothetical protein
MKKLPFTLGILVCSTLLFLGGCENAETLLDLTITTHPQGGGSVERVSCTFEGFLETIGGGMFGPNDTEPVSVSAEWWWEDSNNQNDELMDSETFTVTNETPTSFTTTYSAATGYILLNYYWVKLTWTDAEGSHTVESGKAFCQR